MLKVEEVVEMTKSGTSEGQFLFTNVFLQQNSDLYVGRHAARMQSFVLERIGELTNVEQIPLTIFPKYNELLFGKAFDPVPVNSFLKRPRLLYYFANKSTIPELSIQ